jgi:hypothetical protein
MKEIVHTILDEVCGKLMQAEAFSGVDVPGLRELLSGGAKPKAADIVRILSASKDPPSGVRNDPD